jgi:hypothetical protein
MRSRRHGRHPAVWNVLAALLLTCGGAGCAGAQDGAALPDADARRADAFPVREVARSREDTLFTQIAGMDVDSRGRVYAGDWMMARVAVLDSSGALVRTIGRKGLGPGEFRGINGVQVLPGDSLLVHDPSAGRLSVFAPDSGRAAYVTTLASAPLLIRRTPANDAHLALMRPPFTVNDTVQEDVLRLLNLDGSPRGEPLRRFPGRSFLRVNQGGGFSVMPNPFGHAGLFALSRDGTLHYGWNAGLEVESTDLQGRRTGGFAIPYNPPRVSQGDVESAVADMPAQAVRMFRSALEDSLPERWPAVAALHADERGRVWMGLHGPADQPHEWALFENDGRYVGSAFLPREAEVFGVRDGRFYAAERGEDDVQSVVIFRVDVQPRGRND